MPQRISNDERDDMTPEIFETLKRMGSPKIKRGKYVVHDPKTFDKSRYHTFTGNNDYMAAAGNIRTSQRNRNYYPKDFVQAPFAVVRSIPKDKSVKDWVIVTDDNARAQEIYSVLKDMIINPGCLFVTEGALVFNVRAHSLREFFDAAKELPEDFWNCYPSDKITEINI